MTRQFGRIGSVSRFGRVLGLVLVGVCMVSLISSTAEAKFRVKDQAGDKEIKLDFYGFSQFEARAGEGYTEEGGVFFQAQRVRWGANYHHAGPIKAKLFLDFNQSFTSMEGGLRKVIKDAFIGYRYANEFMVRLGMIKTPLGMDFTVPGWNLDIIERQGLEKSLVLERDFGVTVSGRLIGQDNFTDKPMKTNGLEMGAERQGYGFGYDVGVYNPAGRSKAVNWDDFSTKGDALCFVGRVHFDYGKPFHCEAAYGVSQQAGGAAAPGDPDTEDYTVLDVGVASEIDKIEAKAEFIMGDGIKGVKDVKQNCIVGTLGYLVHPNVQAVVKHYHATSEVPGMTDYTLGNTYVGLNFYPFNVTNKHRDLQRHKIVVNVIFPSGDKDEWNGLGGVCETSGGVQWQIKY